MARKKVKKTSAWYKCYQNVLKNVKKKYPEMSKEAQNIRAWKGTNAIFNKRVNKNENVQAV